MTRLLSSSSAEYAGRRSDLLAFDGITPGPQGELRPLQQALALPGQSGAVIAGIEKLIQRFLLELLTEQGSLHYLPHRGTAFMIAIRAGVVRTSQDLFARFSSAEVDVRNNLRQEELPTDPPDERYGSASLLSATLDKDTAILNISIRSRAGDERELLFPLRISPGRGT